MSYFAYRQRITQTEGPIEYLADQGDTLLFFDYGSTVAEIDVSFPADPTDGLLFALTTRFPITAVNLYSQYYPFSGPDTISLTHDTPVCWFYSVESNRWFKHN